LAPEIKRPWIEWKHPQLSVSRQCGLAGLARSSFYHAAVGGESLENLRLMRKIDALYLKRPFYGSPRITDWLRQLGWRVNEKRVARLMRVMAIQAIVPGPHTSRPHPVHRIYPYLLRGRAVQAANEVWCADITYVPLIQGFMYLVAVMDWFSRYVLAWDLSNTLDEGFCVSTLQRALAQHGTPGIFNTDQGAQFTSEAFTGALQRAQVQISMDGRGRALDNVFVERLWRSVKYEDVYPRDYRNGTVMHQGLCRYFRFYNTQRRHQALERRTPAAVYFGKN